MPTINLTDRTIRAARAEGGQRLELWDEGCPGLCLRVSPTGARTFIYRYRAADGRQPRLKLGDYSDAFGLSEARRKANKVRVEVQDGRDPATERRKARAKAKEDPARSFNDLADLFLKASERGEWKLKSRAKSPRTIADERGVLERHIRPVLGRLPPAAIDRRAVRSLLNGMRDQGIGAQVVKAHATIRGVFSYAIAEEIGGVLVNPAVGFPTPVSVKARERALTDDELRALWIALESDAELRLPGKDGQPGAKLTVGRPMRIALQLLMLLIQRRGEVAGMSAAELDLERALWSIPGERMKGRRRHLVPLAPRAVELIREAFSLAGATGSLEAPLFVFPARGDARRPIRADSLNHAFAAFCHALGIEGATIHDLRRTGSTYMTSERLGVQPFHRSLVLGHSSDKGGGAGVSADHYDANLYLSERRRALEAWEGLLLEIVGEQASVSNVVKIAGRVG